MRMTSRNVQCTVLQGLAAALWIASCACGAETSVAPRRQATTNTPDAGPGLPSDRTRDDTEALQGVWLVKRMASDGMKAHLHEIQGLVYTFTGDKLSWGTGGRSVKEYLFTLNASAVPKRIDMRRPGGDERFCGIYKIEKGRLTICFPSDGNLTNRPAAFACTWTTRTELTELERLKPGAQIPGALGEGGNSAFTLAALGDIPPTAQTRAAMLAALEKDPTSSSAITFLCLRGAADDQTQSLSGLSRQEAVARCIREFKQADQILDAAIRAGGVNTELLEDRRLVLQKTSLLPLLLEAGTNYLAEASAILERVKEYIHSPSEVHSIYSELGRVALQANRLSLARSHLRNAGKVLWAGPNFDPDMQLARELLEHGEKEDREAVLAFLEDVIRSRRQPDPTNANAQNPYAGNLKKLEGWRQDIRNGKTPLDW